MGRLCTALLTMAAMGMAWGAGAREADAFSAARVYREASPSVVVIFGFDRKGAGSSGTGTVITKSGLVLTNSHVIFDPKTKQPFANIQVFLKPGRVTGDDKQDLKSPLKVKVLARDTSLDLALLQLVRPPSGLRPVEIGDSEEVEIGEDVAAIGHPGGGGLWTLTTGTVSSARRDGARDVFQTDTAINPGNSGGPLLDSQARLIGVNTFVRRVNKQGLPLEGLNYSLRSSLALSWLDRNGVTMAAVRRRSPSAVAGAVAQPGHSEPAAETAPAPEPATDEAPLAGGGSSGEEEPSAGQEPSAGGEPSAGQEPSAEEEPSAGQEPSASGEPSAGREPSADGEPAEAQEPPSAEPSEPTLWDDEPDDPPTPHAEPDPPAPTDEFGDQPHEFLGENGETMYGVPNRNFRLDQAMKEVYKQALKNAGDAFGELDDESMDDF